MSRPCPPLATLLAWWILGASLLCACDPTGADGTGGQPGEPPGLSGAVPGTLPGNSEVRREFEGHWWVFAPDMPTHALFMSLEPAGSKGRWHGSWVSFDWRGTEQPTQLTRVSRPVEVTARSEGEQTVIVGPVPQVDAQGRPTGRRGQWELRVTQTNLAGQPLHYSGRIQHSDPTQAVDLPVELSTSFRAWSR